MQYVQCQQLQNKKDNNAVHKIFVLKIKRTKSKQKQIIKQDKGQ